LGVGWEGNAIGFSHWYNPGSVNNGFLGFCDVIVVAAVAYSGTELVGLTAAETREPKIALPKAVKAVF
jgi:amino acid transporter